MRSPLPLAVRPAVGDFDTKSAGPAMAVLDMLIIRITVLLRGIALAEMVVQVIIWHAFYQASPWLLWGPAVALAWGCTSIAYLRRHRPRWQFICADTAVYSVLAFGAAWCVPTAIRGEAGSWLFILVTTQALLPIWLAPGALSLPLAVTPVIAFGVGTALAPTSRLVGTDPRQASLTLLFVVVAVHVLIRRMLCGRAMKADAALAAAHQEARDQYVILSETIERREQDRLMHDTILNTLTAIARSGGPPAAISQCRQDIALLESVLSQSGGAESGGTGAPGWPGTGLVAAIEAVVIEKRARGLAVDLEITGGVAAQGGGQEPARVPGPVVAAIAHATREALANVAGHAGTGRAWVAVSVTPGEAPGAGRIQVIVRDAGCGFDPDRVDPAQLGVRRSITERVEDWGGSAWVRSAPGEGTTVSLCWPADDPGARPAGLQVAGAAGRGELAQW
jgi:signal transduction histidine kinase